MGQLVWPQPDLQRQPLRPGQQFDFTYKVPLLKSPLEQYYLMQGGFKRTDLNDTQADSTTLGVSRFWEMSSGWQRAINLRWSLITLPRRTSPTPPC